MPMTTDWIMVGITAVYVVATIIICWANMRSAKATKEQLNESKRQFEETQRLQVMPYLQVKVEDGKVNENGDPECPYTTFEISDSENDNRLQVIRYISFENVGLGMLHHTSIKWNSLSKKDDGYPANDVVIPPHVEWGINARFIAKGSGTEDLLKSIVAPCSINIRYEDLLGNMYEQEVRMSLIIDCSHISGWSYYYITSPKLLD